MPHAAVTTAAFTPQHGKAYCRLPRDSVAWQPGAGPHVGVRHLEGAEEDVRDVQSDILELSGHVLTILEVHGQPLDLRAPPFAGSHLAPPLSYSKGTATTRAQTESMRE